MTLSRRVIVCLDVAHGRVVKGVHFRMLRDIGDPAAMAARYEADGADEIVLLDIMASPDGRETRWETVRRTAERLFIPLTVGGGIRSAAQVAQALRAGADKVAVNSAAVARPELITEAALRFGAQCVVVSIDAKRDMSVPSGWRVYVRGGRTATSADAVAWAEECVERGAGEILLTSIDKDGDRAGYDLALTRVVATAVRAPVVASGGAGNSTDVCAVLADVDGERRANGRTTSGRADAALVAGILHDRLITVAEIKSALAGRGIPVRDTRSLAPPPSGAETI